MSRRRTFPLVIPRLIRVSIFYFENEVIVNVKDILPLSSKRAVINDIYIKNYGFLGALLGFQFRLSNMHFPFASIPFDVSRQLIRQFLISGFDARISSPFRNSIQDM